LLPALPEQNMTYICLFLVLSILRHSTASTAAYLSDTREISISVGADLQEPDFCKKVCPDSPLTTCGRTDPRFKDMFSSAKQEIHPTWIPDQSCTICPHTAKFMRSLDLPNAVKVTVSFINTSGEMAHLYWQNFAGEPHFLSSLQPGGRYISYTREGHAFRFWNQDYSAVSLDYVAGRLALANEWNYKTYDPRATGYFEKDVVRLDAPVNWQTCRHVRFVNRADYNIDLFWANFTGGEDKIAQLYVGESHYEITYPRHKFRARLHIPGNEQLLTEVEIGDIKIPDCGRRRACQCTADFEAPNVGIWNGLMSSFNATATSLSGPALRSLMTGGKSS